MPPKKPERNGRQEQLRTVRFSPWLLLLIWMVACASDDAVRGPEILHSSPLEPELPTADQVEPPSSLLLPPRNQDGLEIGYRLVVESSGDREVFESSDTRKREPARDSTLLELEYRAVPVTTPDLNGERLVLDALHYKVVSQNPPGSREIEAGSDRLRIFSNGEQVVDIEGTAPKVDLTPRKLLYRPFALLGYNELGEVVTLQAQGQRAVRNFLREMPVRSGLLYSNVTLPAGEIQPGDTWSAKRYPPNIAGTVGLSVDVEYSFAGYADIEGVRCAWLLLKANSNEENVPSSAGFSFDRVVTDLDGEAWIEVSTSRVRRMVVEDTIRAAYQQGKPPAKVTVNRMRYRTRLFVEQRDPGEVPIKWEDGQERFDLR